ncbi:MAG: retropepsin-like aspartic protease [Bacteroidota bacterium]
MKIKYIITLLIIVLFTNQTIQAQRAVQALYLSSKSKSADSNWFAAYCQAEYSEAHRLLTEQDTPPPKNQFLTNAQLYAYQKGKTQRPKVDAWGMEFYQDFPKTTIEWGKEKQVKLPLKRNLFEAVIEGDTFRVVFDTGGQGISVSKQLVEKYGYAKDTTISGMSYLPAFKRTSKQSPTIIKEISFGSITLKNLKAKFTTDVIEEGQLKSDQQYDVFMGVDILIGLIDFIRFDWMNEELTFAKEPIAMTEPQDFFFFDAKPITITHLEEKPLTTLIDTGSPVDVLSYDSYKDSYTKKEEKKYGDYAYHVYTVPIEMGTTTFNLGVADYMYGFKLKLDGEIIDLIIGTGHRQLTLNLRDNLLEVR